MIKGFENITTTLTDDERTAAEEILESFKTRKSGKENAVTAGKIAEGMVTRMRVKYKINMKFPGARIRKIIHYIRVYKMPSIVADEKGYYRASSKQELFDYKLSLEQRIGAQKQILDALDREIKAQEGSQTQMFK